MVSRYNKDPDYELKVVRSLALARSFESELALVMVNAGGPKEKGFMGGSGAWAPLLGNIGGFEDSQVGIKMIDVDLSVLKVRRVGLGVVLMYRMRETHTKSGRTGRTRRSGSQDIVKSHHHQHVFSAKAELLQAREKRSGIARWAVIHVCIAFITFRRL